jgi:DNA-binding GntR family transcriptional regulator
MRSIRRDSPVPPWRQLAASLRRRIESGELPPGSRLPSIMDLADQYSLAPVTVRKALDALKREGLIVTQSGWGTFVREPRP